MKFIRSWDGLTKGRIYSVDKDYKHEKVTHGTEYVGSGAKSYNHEEKQSIEDRPSLVWIIHHAYLL